MRSKFPGYFNLTTEQYNAIWDEALFVFDANILLNLYRYSEDTRDEVLKILTLIQDRVWIPHQAAKEFLNRRLTVISSHAKSYNEAIGQLDSLVKNFENNKQHPFISDGNLSKLKTVTGAIKDDLKANQASEVKKATEDPLLTRIEAIFENKVGDAFTPNDEKALREIGRTRFEQRIPPGYMDRDKAKDDPTGSKQYGDFFIWKQILSHAKAIKSHVIFVTDDRKEDWWTEFQGMSIHARPELIKEFAEETKKSILIYQSDHFLKYAGSYFKKEVDVEAIREIEGLRKEDKPSAITALVDAIDYISKAKNYEETLRHQLVAINFEKQNLLITINEIEKDENKDNKKFAMLNKLKTQYEMVNQQTMAIDAKLKDLQKITSELYENYNSSMRLL